MDVEARGHGASPAIPSNSAPAAVWIGPADRQSGPGRIRKDEHRPCGISRRNRRSDQDTARDPRAGNPSSPLRRRSPHAAWDQTPVRVVAERRRGWPADAGASLSVRSVQRHKCPRRRRRAAIRPAGATSRRSGRFTSSRSQRGTNACCGNSPAAITLPSDSSRTPLADAAYSANGPVVPSHRPGS